VRGFKLPEDAQKGSTDWTGIQVCGLALICMFVPTEATRALLPLS